MLEVGGVVAARRQDDIDAAAVHMIHDGLERLPVAAVVADGALAERLRAHWRHSERAISGYDAPDGMRRLSSRTYQTPFLPLTRSMPEMWL